MVSLASIPSNCVGRRALAPGLILALGVSSARGQESRSLGGLLLNRNEPQAAPEDEVEAREEFIESDRNSFTFAPFTPGRGRLIFERAFRGMAISNVQFQGG